MNQFTFILILLTGFGQYIFAQNNYTDKKGHKQLLGSIKLNDLKGPEFKEWFDKGYEGYLPELKFDLSTELKDVEVLIYMGTWCGDTRKYLPQFIKLWHAAGLSTSQLEFIALHHEDNEYKRSPERTEVNYNIHRVPTFIFERNGHEIGRIIERPINDFQTDLTQIALGIPSKPRYPAVAMIQELFQSVPLDSLFARYNDISYAVSRELTGPSELNTFGYVMKAAGRLDEAEFIFTLNTRLFPFDPNLYDSLGELYLKMEKYEEARKCFLKVLEIKKSDPHSSEMLALISRHLEK